jgi:hypothetical protein
MGASLFGGGTSKIDSTSLTNQDTTQSGTSNTNQNQNANTTQAQNGTTAQSGTSTSNPTDFQLPYMATGLSNAQALKDKLAPVYANASQTYTPISGQQRSDMDALAQWARSIGAPAGTSLMGTGTNLTGALGQAQGAAGDVLNRTFANPTQANITDAGAYANNPYTQGMITAAQTPIERQLNEVSIPGLNIAANNTGNTDSSRAAMTEAILRRSAGEDEANVASNILGNQYSSGLNLAENARTANQTSDLNSKLAAMGILSGVGSTGANMAVSGNGMALQDMNVPVQEGQMLQQDANAANANDYANTINQADNQWKNLANYWNLVGHPLGTTTTSSQNGTTQQNGVSDAVSSGSANTLSDSQSHTNGITNTNGTQTQPGPGILGGLLGAASGIGSFFAPTGALGLGPSMFKSLFG